MLVTLANVVSQAHLVAFPQQSKLFARGQQLGDQAFDIGVAVPTRPCGAQIRDTQAGLMVVFLFGMAAA